MFSHQSGEIQTSNPNFINKIFFKKLTCPSLNCTKRTCCIEKLKDKLACSVYFVHNLKITFFFPHAIDNFDSLSMVTVNTFVLLN